MALRCLLISLVAGLGFDLPSGQDVTGWKVMGRDWVTARSVDLSALEAEASGWLGLSDPTIKLKDAAVAETIPLVPTNKIAAVPAEEREVAFAAINEEMAVTMANDEERLARAKSVPAPTLALEADMRSTSLDAPGEVLCQPEIVAADLAVPTPAAVTIVVNESHELEDETVATDRLNSAVRLTREAVCAWASLMQSVGSDTRTR